MLVSPAERAPFTSLGKTSPIPEKLGVDFLTFSPTFGTVGIQRKAIPDLIASLGDRIPRERIDMKSLGLGIWLIEGTPQWSNSGDLLTSYTKFTRASFMGILFSLQADGYWVVRSDSIDDSMEWLRALDKWVGKDGHRGLNGRSGPKSVFGVNDERDWDIFLAQSLAPGVGYDKARAIVDHYEGLPFQLKEGVRLTEVPGIGKTLAKRIEKRFT